MCTVVPDEAMREVSVCVCLCGDGGGEGGGFLFLYAELMSS